MSKLFFTISFVLLATMSFSQSIIPKLGLTLPVLYGEDITEASFYPGYTVGMGVNLPLGKGRFSLQPEVNFVNKGAILKDGALPNISNEMRLKYLELPVLFKVSFGSTIKFFLNAGPSIGLGVGGKSRIIYNGDAIEEYDVKFGEGDDEDVFYVQNKTDFGMQFGLGLNIAGKVIIDVREGLGLSSLDDDSDVKNNLLQFTVGFPIRLK